MVEYFESNEVMDPTQYRVRHERSTISPILSFSEDIISKLENGDDVDAIYLDLWKAFDKVDHNLLLYKIKALNIIRKILKSLETFVKKKQQIVKVNGHLSDWVWVLLGVLQGSVLGPPMFAISRNTQNANSRLLCRRYKDGSR